MPELTVGRIVYYVDETPDDYNSHAHLPAIVQCIYQTGPIGHIHLHVFEAYPQDDRAVDASFSKDKEPGTWHWIEKA